MKIFFDFVGKEIFPETIFAGNLQNYYCAQRGSLCLKREVFACANNDDTHTLHVRANLCCLAGIFHSLNCYKWSSKN